MLVLLRRRRLRVEGMPRRLVGRRVERMPRRRRVAGVAKGVALLLRRVARRLGVLLLQERVLLLQERVLAPLLLLRLLLLLLRVAARRAATVAVLLLLLKALDLLRVHSGLVAAPAAVLGKARGAPAPLGLQQQRRHRRRRAVAALVQAAQIVVVRGQAELGDHGRPARAQSRRRPRLLLIPALQDAALFARAGQEHAAVRPP
mmetsp:Transcript_31989/g.107690  ORF Transcript_31989/g.107690 Transcript_31989/m.107690 type:complete len:203 (+) Transcript_31989:205-813(+)